MVEVADAGVDEALMSSRVWITDTARRCFKRRQASAMAASANKSASIPMTIPARAPWDRPEDVCSSLPPLPPGLWYLLVNICFSRELELTCPC